MATEAGEDPRILLVEDDEVLAASLREILGPLGEVEWCASGEAGLGRLSESSFDLLITDIELPGIDGIAVLERSAEIDPDLAVLVLSGHERFDYAVAAIRGGAADYLSKPVGSPALLAKAAELVATTRGRRAGRRGESVLAIGAHPDDVEIGCGGILLRHGAEGDHVSVLTLTGGEAGGAVAVRAEESRRAAELLSAELIHTDLADTSVNVSDGGVTIGVIEEAIRTSGATTVYTHTSRDVHQDHRHVHSASLVAARGVPRLYCYQAPSTTVEFHPTRFVDIEDFLEAKLAVIAAYASQTEKRAYLEEDLLRATARYWGRFAAARYAEPLEVVRDAERPLATSERSSASSS